MDVIDTTINAVQQQFPSLVFRLVGPVDAHHNLARFTGELGADGADPVAIGFDVAVLVPDGRQAPATRTPGPWPPTHARSSQESSRKAVARQQTHPAR